MKKLFLLAAVFFFIPADARSAQIHTDLVEYRHGDTVLEGFIAYEDTEEVRPAVVVVHEWMGLNGYAQKRAVQLAEMGYVAFAIDIYGKGIRPKTREEAAAQAGIYKNDRALTRARAQEGLKVLQAHPLVNAERIAAIGYCFGGMVVLEMARASADLAGVVSFHGPLDTPDPLDANNIKGKVLVCHGANDPYVPEKDVAAFQKEMRDAHTRSMPSRTRIPEMTHPRERPTTPRPTNVPGRR
jgi:dienelactone hydrolase